MRPSPELMTMLEPCYRAGFWARDWRKFKLKDTEFLHKCIAAGLTTDRSDYGEFAGEESFVLGAEPGLDSKEMNLYDQVVHLGSLADIITCVVRKPEDKPWVLAPDVDLDNGIKWKSAAYLSPDGSHLRRISLVSGWGDDRHYHEARSWYSLGEACIYGLPLKQATIVIGQSKNGKRHSFLSHALRHPQNRKLRFRKRNKIDEPFKSSWIEIWREDYDDVSTSQWISSMYEDKVLGDCCFSIDVPVPEKPARQKIIDLASRRLEHLMGLKTLPEQQLGTCDWPSPCIFRGPCHSGDSPSGKSGFIPVESMT